MANPFSGIITSDLKLLFNNMIGALLEDDALTRPCQFIYGITKYTQCNNCVYNAATGKSSGTYLAGGPIPFYSGKCPVCAGEGKIAVTTEEDDIYLAVIYNHKKWLPMKGSSVLTPEDYIQTICAIDLLPKIKRAKEIIVNTDLVSYVRQRYILEGEPQPIGFGSDDFLVTMWKRAG